jgi:glycosyltransferase involved in cell wall biosynthesis
MSNARKRLKINSEKNFTVPTGAHFDKIQRVSFDSLKRKTLVWSGRMEPWSGLDMIMNSLPQILVKIPDLKVVLIGDGPMMKHVLDRSKELKLQDHLELTGWIPHKKVLEIVPKLGVAVALLSPDPINFYTDMIKIKEYLACGCPVIMTLVPNIAHEIKNKEAGISIHYKNKEFVQAVVKLMSDDVFYKRCRSNALRLGEKYDWTKIFSDAFRNTLNLMNDKQNNKKGGKERIE